MSPYYEYKKESFNKKFSATKNTLALMQGAMKEYKKGNSIYIKRAIIGYYQDFTEYIIDMCETYLAMTDNYEDGLSASQIIRKASIYGFIESDLENTSFYSSTDILYMILLTDKEVTVKSGANIDLVKDIKSVADEEDGDLGNKKEVSTYSC